MKETEAPETIAATSGIAVDAAFGAVVPPLHLSSTYTFAGFEKPRRHEYSRTSNPTRDQLAEALARLEGGVGAVVTATGMAAVDLVLTMLTPSQLVIAPHDCYGGTYRLLSMRAAKGHFRTVFVDQNNGVEFGKAITQNPALILVETPSNPLMRVTDIRQIAEDAAAVGAKVAVDNTFLSPALQQPISLGADIVIHSTTKFINGHSDVVGGAVIAADDGVLEHLKAWANITGVTGSPFDSYMTLRGLRTLFARIERQQRNAMAVADFLSRQENVIGVHYPGLPDHPAHEVVLKQQSGFGAMLSFELAGGVGVIARFVDALVTFKLAESLGGVESLIAHPATMTHSNLSPEMRRSVGISDGLFRLSIGLEDERDLLDDLERALRVIS